MELPQLKTDSDVVKSASDSPSPTSGQSAKKPRSRKNDLASDSSKRRCVSTACIACRRRKSKCDGNTPACAACSSVYGTECVYDPNSDHRRKGVYKKDIDNLKTRNSTLQTLIQAILNSAEDDVPDLIQQIRTCESLDAVAEDIITKENDAEDDDEDLDASPNDLSGGSDGPTFESQLSGNIGQLTLEGGVRRYIGGTSHLKNLGEDGEVDAGGTPRSFIPQTPSSQQHDPITTWTRVTGDPELIMHLLNHYFTWHYTFFTCLSKNLFFRDFLMGRQPRETRRRTEYCTPLLVNTMLALGCHFTSWPAARANPDDSATAGDHFFKEAKRLILENDEHETPKLANVQAFALMSMREAGCGREAKGWVYSGMAFRMVCDLGLNLNRGGLAANSSQVKEEEEDAGKITMWGCYLFDKCWSNYLGRMPQLQIGHNVTAKKFDVFPGEDSDLWSPYTDAKFSSTQSQPSRTRAVALQICGLCEISSDLMNFFYHPSHMDKHISKQVELKRLSEIHSRLETWRRNLPKEMEPKEGGLPSVLVMHMFFQLLYIHLFRPFLKYTHNTSPLPSNVSPRKLCTQAATMISKLLRLYKRSHGLRQVCNIVVYINHTACTIHLLNLPEKTAKRDITHGVKHLEEISESWLCARRTLKILSGLVRKWKVELPDEAASVLGRACRKFALSTEDGSPQASAPMAPPPEPLPRAALTDHAVYNGQDRQVASGMNYINPQPMSNGITYRTDDASMNGMGYNADMVANMATHAQAMQGQAAPPSTNGLHQGRMANTVMPQQHSNVSNFSRQIELPMDTSTGPSERRGSTSPSQMFGGVEALLREGHEWWVKDQAQIAVGFDNWNSADADTTWMNAAPAKPQQQATSMPPSTAAGLVSSNGFGSLQNAYYQESDWYK